MNEYGIYNKFNHIICVSKYTARSFVNYYPQLSQKVSYMYNVLDIEKINELALYNVMDKRFNVTNDSFVCISVGRYVDVKQFDRIPSIVSQVMSKGISKKLLWYIIGDGDEKLIKYTNEEIKKYGLEAWYTQHNKGVFPMDANGVPFTSAYIASTGNPIVDLQENLAAEEKARATYENLMDLTNDESILAPLSFLRQREVIHYNRFKELLDYYKSKGY